MFTTIMWATDRSPTTERVLPLAKELAAGGRAKLIVTHIEKITTVAGKPVFVDSTTTLDSDLHHMVDQLVSEGIDAELVEAEVRKGSAAHKLVELARDAGADLILLGSHGKGPLAGVFLGASPTICSRSRRAPSWSCPGRIPTCDPTGAPAAGGSCGRG